MNYENITLEIHKDKYVQCPVHSCFPIFDKTGKFNSVHKNSQLRISSCKDRQTDRQTDRQSDRDRDREKWHS
jgi:hypothetical protein